MATSDQYKGVDNADKNISIEEIQPSTLENIDFAFFDFVNDNMNSGAITNEGWKETPVIWVSAERSFLSKNNKDLRDDDGSLILPLITIERTNVVKDPTKKGVVWANIPPVNDEKGGSITSNTIKDGRLVTNNIFKEGGLN